MLEHEIRESIEEVRTGTLPRREFIQRMVAVGLSAPTASMLLMHAGIAQAQPTPAYKPTKRGGGGPLKVLWWQGATLLQPHFANGTKDQEGSRIFYEPLAVWDNDGNLVPILAAEIPSRENGGLTADGKSVTWKLKRGVTWHDGQPFTADDCLFTWEYAKDPATAAVTSGVYKDVVVTKVDSHTIKVAFAKATPFWATAFVAAEGMIIPKHVFGPYAGAKSREAPGNLKPVGTGPYKFVDFKPGDMVRGEINNNYHMPNRPYFDSIEMKGGGDATSAARAVLQTGEYDYAWNLQVEDEVLKRMEDGGKGRAHIIPSGDIEFMQLSLTDPWTEVDGERSSLKSKHFAFTEPQVREAMALLADRNAIQQFIYGRTGVATSNFLNNPAKYRSPNTKFEFNIDKASALLDAAGWKKGADGIREKGGKKMKFVFQTSVNGIRQKEQAVIKQACQKAGIDLELKSVTASVFFSSDVANPDTYGKFWCDMQMYTTTMTQPDPERFMDQYTIKECSTKANKWQGRNIARWRNEEYDKLFAQGEAELDPVKRAALFIRMNDMVVKDNAIIPLISRPRVRGANTKLVTSLSGWDLDFSVLQNWYREA
ncbi:peptide ABC transporter substrate-binding protein [Caenimonas koreensis]|uniref:Peptide ABC transporter substrate-binding protein n=1 Tax=Caenimonas koreensis DSM 17982 TaxID=1121255 RepID=A0A844APS4_9BURK|nr:peptide ABC transporter substrate-binding protein [Caenimonas koreensis]MRD46170.1 peptide ABC transporter substrate-binding protein [Caenimonas koreensis DSM 17982]